ncbi:hypothetical protein FOIG_12589 [Fusarium odoratissimum NRRL 54006]|uniref:Uncharacterized protein n=1 Tax=Fusarium odoratissimum (strain NRRL 54006) TaxID=1089451 RepID=X0J0L8_FUSO5|nr:uncharacterized protein FOIG_12589 [Fusarium odoratissimum NRRL 54006]EXL94743.1 hypothetical protein FOIG_12589 [Fusarium odoratissimum NRRL 54006]
MEMESAITAKRSVINIKSSGTLSASKFDDIRIQQAGWPQAADTYIHLLAEQQNRDLMAPPETDERHALR